MSIFAKKKGWGGLLSLVIAARMPVLVMPAVLDGVGIGGLQQRLVHAEVAFVVFAGGLPDAPPLPGRIGLPQAKHGVQTMSNLGSGGHFSPVLYLRLALS